MDTQTEKEPGPHKKTPPGWLWWSLLGVGLYVLDQASKLWIVHRFPLKSIKIDRSFIRDLGQPDARRSLAIIEAVQGLARSLNLSVVAEGVETDAQRQALLAAGCPCAQGFLFGRPQPAGHWRAGAASGPAAPRET